MKKLIGYVALAAGLLVAGSCQKESAQGGDAQETVKTAFRVEIPSEEATRAVAEAEKVDSVYYEVWDEAFQQRLFPYVGSAENRAPVSGGVAEIMIDLVKDQTFNLIFWAQNSGCHGVGKAYTWSDLKTINVDYSKFTSDQKDVYDAFYAVLPDVKGDGSAKTVYLYRPFAQVNFCASEMSSSMGNIELTGNTVKVSEVATAFDTINGVGINPSSGADGTGVTFSSGAGLVEDKKIEVNDATYDWVSMNYLLVASSLVEVEADFYTNFGTVHRKVIDVPVQKNYRTNILGDLFLAGTNIKIVVSPDFTTPEMPPIEIK